LNVIYFLFIAELQRDFRTLSTEYDTANLMQFPMSTNKNQRFFQLPSKKVTTR